MAAPQTIILEEDFDPTYEPTQDEIVEYAEFLGMNLTEDPDLIWIAREGLKAPLPKDWKPCQTQEGEVCIFTHTSVCHVWLCSCLSRCITFPLPVCSVINAHSRPTWYVCVSLLRQVYYFNFSSGDSTWEHPCDEYYKKMFGDEKRKKTERAAGGSGSVNGDTNRRKSSLVSGNTTGASQVGTLGALKRLPHDVSKVGGEGSLPAKKSLGPIGRLQDGLAAVNSLGTVAGGALSSGTTLSSGSSSVLPVTNNRTSKPLTAPSALRPLHASEEEVGESSTELGSGSTRGGTSSLPPRPGSANPNSIAAISSTDRPRSSGGKDVDQSDTYRKDALRRDSEERERLDRELKAARQQWTDEQQAREQRDRQDIEERSAAALARLRAEATERGTA
jgi:hypothetical protein